MERRSRREPQGRSDSHPGQASLGPGELLQENTPSSQFGPASLEREGVGSGNAGPCKRRGSQATPHLTSGPRPPQLPRGWRHRCSGAFPKVHSLLTVSRAGLQTERAHGCSALRDGARPHPPLFRPLSFQLPASCNGLTTVSLAHQDHNTQSPWGIKPVPSNHPLRSGDTPSLLASVFPLSLRVLFMIAECCLSQLII